MTPPAVSPLMWAMSQSSSALTWSQIYLNFLQSISLEYELAPATISFGRYKSAVQQSLSQSMIPVFQLTLQWSTSKNLETEDIFLSGVWYPWDKWPPWGRSRDIILSKGFNTPLYTAKLAGDPESACTLTPHSSGLSLKTFSALVWHRIQTLSQNSTPPQYLEPGYPSEYLQLMTEPSASNTAREEWFSEGMRLMPSFCLSSSHLIMSLSSGSLLTRLSSSSFQQLYRLPSLRRLLILLFILLKYDTAMGQGCQVAASIP